MKKVKLLVACVIVGGTVAACQDVDSDTATAIFRDCLERNGVVAEEVTVTMNADSIESISLQVVSEGEVPYEPNVRLACSEEIEN